MKRSAFGLIAVLMCALYSTAAARDITAKQVAVPVKIVEASDLASKDLGIEYTLFQPIAGRDMKADVALVIKPRADGSSSIEASIVSFGRGADFRRIDTLNPVLRVQSAESGLDSVLKTILQPADIEKVQVAKGSVAAPAAPFLFGLIGSQYEGPGAKAASTPGQVCPTTGQPLSEGSHGGRGDIASGIDKAGMAAGMGLLASQAKGELDGLKVRWELTPTMRYNNFDLKFDAYNKNTKRTEPLTATVQFDLNTAAGITRSLKYLPIQYKAYSESGDVQSHVKVLVTPHTGNRLKIAIDNYILGAGGVTGGWTARGPQLEYSGADQWDDYEHEWDDFDEDGYCYDCGHYDPYADEYNYDANDNYIGDRKILADRLTKIMIDPERSEAYTQGAVSGQKMTFITDYPVTKALFKTQAFNKETNQLLVFVTPVIIKADRED